MICAKDIAVIDKNYFRILSVRGFYITLQSKNTGHYWHLLERMERNRRTFVISHRHGGTGSYHLQRTRPSVKECCAYIKDHAAYQLRKDRARAQRLRDHHGCKEMR